MIISLKKAYELLENCSAIMVDANALVYPVMYEQGIKSNNHDFMELKWEADDSYYEITFSKDENEEVEIQCDCMFLKEEDGTKHCITLLQPLDIEAQFLIENFG